MLKILALILIITLPMTARAENGFVLLELFTSEGCSSCPAADRILTEYHERAKTLNIDIFTISHHVDYWNYLGWIDPFSSKIATQRQRNYAALLSDGRAFTPQLIVNGQLSLVGSDQNGISKAIHDFLKNTENLLIFDKIDNKDDKYQLEYTVKESVEKLEILFFLVGTPDTSKVTAGENSGKKLNHSNSVITYSSDKEIEVGKNLYIFPKPLKNSFTKISLLAVLQSDKTMKIFGSDEISLPEPK